MPEDHSPGSIYMIGDCFEEEMENLHVVGRNLSERNIPVRAFHEGSDPAGDKAYKAIADLTKGSFVKFGPGCEANLDEACEAAMIYDTQGAAAFERLLASGHRGALAMKDIQTKALPYKNPALGHTIPGLDYNKE
jgi:hypothetical protein